MEVCSCGFTGCSHTLQVGKFHLIYTVSYLNASLQSDAGKTVLSLDTASKHNCSGLLFERPCTSSW